MGASADEDGLEEDLFDVYEALDDETPKDIAKKFSVNLADLLELNIPRIPGLATNAKLMEGTTILLPPDDSDDEDDELSLAEMNKLAEKKKEQRQLMLDNDGGREDNSRAPGSVHEMRQEEMDEDWNPDAPSAPGDWADRTLAKNDYEDGESPRGKAGTPRAGGGMGLSVEKKRKKNIREERARILGLQNDPKPRDLSKVKPIRRPGDDPERARKEKARQEMRRLKDAKAAQSAAVHNELMNRLKMEQKKAKLEAKINDEAANRMAQAAKTRDQLGDTLPSAARGDVVPNPLHKGASASRKEMEIKVSTPTRKVG